MPRVRVYATQNYEAEYEVTPEDGDSLLDAIYETFWEKAEETGDSEISSDIEIWDDAAKTWRSIHAH